MVYATASIAYCSFPYRGAERPFQLSFLVFALYIDLTLPDQAYQVVVLVLASFLDKSL